MGGIVADDEQVSLLIEDDDRHSRNHHDQSEPNRTNDTSTSPAVISLGMYIIVGVVGIAQPAIIPSQHQIISNLESISASYEFGRFMAWSCTFLYFTSRLPQIYLNFKRYTTEGLAIMMFLCALMGNVFYVASILVKSTEPEYLYGALPYLIGSGGTVIFDIIIFVQYLAFPTIVKIE
jgi:uncharacterized protein with PQ loop repeat